MLIWEMHIGGRGMLGHRLSLPWVRENSVDLRPAALHPPSHRTLDPKFIMPTLQLLVSPTPFRTRMLRVLTRFRLLETRPHSFLGRVVMLNLYLAFTPIRDYPMVNMVRCR